MSLRPLRLPWVHVRVELFGLIYMHGSGRAIMGESPPAAAPTWLERADCGK